MPIGLSNDAAHAENVVSSWLLRLDETARAGGAPASVDLDTIDDPLGQVPQFDTPWSPVRPAGQKWKAFTRDALLEMVRQIRSRDAAAASTKLEKMADNPYAFFRGSAGLFYAYLTEREPAGAPVVLCNGDVHPGNYGTMPGIDGKPVFGLNDPDESAFAPFTFDLKRGATGFALLARQLDRKHVVEAFVDGYLDALKRFDKRGGEDDHRITRDQASGPVEKLLKDAAKQTREDFLDDLVHDGRFQESARLEPVPALAGPMQTALREYRTTLPPRLRPNAAFLKVKDVAIKRGKGVGSLGRKRWYVLVEGPTKQGNDDIVLEVKETIGSVLNRYAGFSVRSLISNGARVVHGYRQQQVGGDPLYGHTNFGRSCLVRELSPEDLDLDFDELSQKELRAAARTCGEILAGAHARTADHTADDIRDAIRDVLGGSHHFARDVVRFADEAADKIEDSHGVLVDMVRHDVFVS